MVKTKTLTQRVAELEADNKKLHKRLKKICKRLDELEAEDDLFPPDLTPEEREQQELADRYWRIGF